MTGCMDGQGVFAQNRTIPPNIYHFDDSGPDRNALDGRALTSGVFCSILCMKQHSKNTMFKLKEVHFVSIFFS